MKKVIRLLTLIILMFAFTASVVSAQTHRHRWSHRKKGAVIGTGAGAATGAIISKDKSKGAVIGGVVGGTAGYLRGRHKDKKEGAIKK